MSLYNLFESQLMWPFMSHQLRVRYAKLFLCGSHFCISVFRWLWLRFCESDVFSSIFASPFIHLILFVFNYRLLPMSSLFLWNGPCLPASVTVIDFKVSARNVTDLYNYVHNYSCRCKMPPNFCDIPYHMVNETVLLLHIILFAKFPRIFPSVGYFEYKST